MSCTSATAWISAQGTEFYTKTWTPAAVPTVAQLLFVHGFVEHIERYNHVFEAYAAQGISVFAYDQRGFGETGKKSGALGATSWALALGDLDHFVGHVAKGLKEGTKLFLMGHSMGGGLSLAYATRNPALSNRAKLSGVIATAPLIRQAKAVKAPSFVVKAGGLLGSLFPKAQIKTVVKPADVCRDPVIQAAYAVDPLCAPVGTYKGVADMLLGGEGLVAKDYKDWPEDLPLLISHGTGDLVTDHDASAEFATKLEKDGKSVTFISYPGFYHEMHNEPGEDKWTMINGGSAWIQSKL